MAKKHGGCCLGCLGQIILVVIVIFGLFWAWENRDTLSEPLFPTDHFEIVATQCEQYGLDPWLIMAMILEESRFDDAATSHAGAKGLMQLMPETAEWAITKGEMEIDLEAALSDPAANIQVGVWYISWLNNHFNGDLYAAIAAYNAGQTNVDHWLTENIWDGSLENSDQIPYNETANYVRSVWRSYKIYHILHDSM